MFLICYEKLSFKCLRPLCLLATLYYVFYNNFFQFQFIWRNMFCSLSVACFLKTVGISDDGSKQVMAFA